MLSVLHEFDLKLLHAVNSEWVTPELDRFMALMTDFGFWKWPLLIAAAALLVWGGYRERLLIVMSFVLIFVGEGVNGTLKHLVNRPRPYQQLEHIRHVARGGVEVSKPGPVLRGRSMPSSHVANNAAVAFLIIAIYGRWARLIWIEVLLVAYSRIYVGSHYPSDVAIAVLLALAYSAALIWWAGQLWKKLGPGWLAELYRRHPDLFPRDPVLEPVASGGTPAFRQ